MINKCLEEIKYILKKDPLKHDISFEDETIEYVCYYNNDIILKTSSFCFYLNRFTLITNIIDAIENIYCIKQFKNVIYYFCYNENYKIETIHMNNSVFHLDVSDYVYFDPKHNILFTYNYKYCTIYKVDEENIKLCTSFDPSNYIYKKYEHLKDIDICIHGIKAYYNNVKQSLHVFVLVNVNNNIFLLFVTITDKTTINLYYINNDAIVLSFEIYSEQILYINCLNNNLLYDFCNNKLNICDDIIFRTEYINNIHSMYIEYKDFFKVVSIIKSKILIIGHYDSISPHISEDDDYIFYIYNKSIFARKLKTNELFISKYRLQDNLIPTCITYKKTQGLLIGCSHGIVLEFGLFF